MARRGLVSKGMGGPQGGGGSALMPKGEKPKGPQLMPVGEVARKLRVEQSHVEGWMQKDQLRGNASGIRPYDFKKFQLDYQEEIKKAQKEALQQKNQSTKSDRKPKKGFFSRFAGIFGGGGKDGDGGGSKKLAQENKKLKSQLAKLQKNQKGQDSAPNRETEEKIRFLEKQVSEGRALEAEVAKLRRQVKEQQPAGSGPVPEEITQELDDARRRLAEAESQLSEGERAKEALMIAQAEKDQLQAALVQLQNQAAQASGDDAGQLEELQRLQTTVQEREAALADMQRRAQDMVMENERLKQEAEELQNQQVAPPPPPEPIESPVVSDPLVDDLIALQEVNLARFRRLHTLYQEAQHQIEQAASAPTDTPPPPEESSIYKQLQRKYKALLAKQSTDNPAHQELMEQLSQSRVGATRLKEENSRLRAKLSSSTGKETARIKELESQLDEAKNNSTGQKLAEKELDSLRKGLESKESQVQKVASKLAENEKRLGKALEESARLTELLIERENRLRELSSEFEQEYREKIGNLDRQVSGLQWKLSLREERIAHLESELLRKGSD